jgi:hypothetical protein
MGLRESESERWQRHARSDLQQNTLHSPLFKLEYLGEQIMGVVRKSLNSRRGHAVKAVEKPPDGSDIGTVKKEKRHDDAADEAPHDDSHETIRGRRLRQGVAQFPMQILVPEETREALRQRSEDTGASIRHIILRSLAADGFPVPRLTRRRS